MKPSPFPPAAAALVATFAALAAALCGTPLASARSSLQTLQAPQGSPPPPAQIPPPDVVLDPPTAPLEPSAVAPPETFPDAGRFIVERRRIKRTVPMDLRTNLDGVWDRLYSVGAGTARRVVYFDWDDNFVYLAAESTQRETVRFDLDARGDGWYRGADNLRFTVSPGVAGDAFGGLDARRWDMVQNKSVPVWAASPIPDEAVTTLTGRTPGGMHAVLLAIGRTELVGLERRPGAELGLRVEFGMLPPDQIADPTQPLPQLTLADTVPARVGGLVSRVELSPRWIVLGESVQATLEVRNTGATPMRLDRLFVRGSKAAQPFLDAAEYTGQTLAPGKTIRRTFRTAVAPGAGMGAIVVAGGAEASPTGTVLATAAFDRVEPYGLALSVDEKPVAAGVDETRTVLVTVTGQALRKAEGTVTLHLPAGWAVEKGNPKRGVTLAFRGETRPLYYKVVIPRSASTGVYAVEATLQIAGKSYSAASRIAVTGNAAALP